MLHKFWVVFILTVHSSLKGIIHPIHHYSPSCCSKLKGRYFEECRKPNSSILLKSMGSINFLFNHILFNRRKKLNGFGTT